MLSNIRIGRKLQEIWHNEGLHVCFRASSVEAVNAFYAAAISKAAYDSGKPGLKPVYSRSYYAAFIQDIDGNKIEIVTFVRE